VKIITDGRAQNGTMRFGTYRVTKGKGPNGEDPNFATVKRGIGTCIHCRQAIEADEIKRQARGESEHGTWQDQLYCIVAVRFQPKLDKHGQPQCYKSGAKKGEIKTEKVRFFRPVNETDLDALKRAELRLRDNWDRWDEAGLIPTERFPQGNDMRPVVYGMTRWCDMFIPRQLLGHLTLVEELNRLKPQIIAELGEDKGRAVVTYLQFAIDKGLDYNSRQTRWEYTRGIIKGTFGRHDFSLKWTFGEMIFSGPNSGAAWGLRQVIDAYAGISELAGDIAQAGQGVTIVNGTAGYMPAVADASVDLVCMDPPYYNNVQYAELSDYFYVWQRRTLATLYPDYFRRRLTNKQEEAVANPDRDGGSAQAKAEYERLMGEIFSECRRVVKDNGILTLMFTHKSQDAWETLTKSLIDSGWNINSSFPVESETTHGIHTKETASAISSIFITCRKRLTDASEPATWIGFGGSGVAQRIRTAVAEGLEKFVALKLNPVDEMVASYGRALRVLSEQWPVLDGDEEVGPVRAMNEASRVVAEHQIKRITSGRLQMEDLTPEAGMALTLYGIYGLAEFSFDEALNLSRSLNIGLETKSGGYRPDGRFVGINTAARSGRRTRAARAEESGFHAPIVRKGSKLRLVLPEERDIRRLVDPQTEWDILHGVIMAFREGDIPVARGYLDRHAEGRQDLIRNLLDVWAAEMGDESLRKEAQAMLFGLK
jgi:adenine-specific DNA methylase